METSAPFDVATLVLAVGDEINLDGSIPITPMFENYHQINPQKINPMIEKLIHIIILTCQ